jgi:membrane associated rhomboid family serine protease
VQILGLHYWASGNFNAAQFVTYMFMHGGWAHLFFNMFAVFMLGSTLEHTWGSKRFLNFYMITGVGAGLIHLFVTFIRIWLVQADMSPDMIRMVYEQGTELWNRTPRMVFSDSAQLSLQVLINVPTVGASGAVFGILLAFGVMFPNAPLYFMFIPVPIKAKYFVIVFGILSFFLGVANLPGDRIAHFAHLGGMLFGIILILYWRKKGRLYG